MLDAIDAGFFNAAGRSSKNDGVILGAIDATFNYSAGAIDEAFPLMGSDVPRSNYFTFDLSSVTETITSAELSLFNPDGGYSSPDATETYELHGAFVSPPPMTGMSALASELTAVYSVFELDELMAAEILFTEITGGPGPLGSVVMSSADDGTTVDISFNSDGLMYLNTFVGGTVVIGGKLSSLDGTTGADEVVFGFTKPLIPGVLASDPPIIGPTPTPSLTLVTSIPEPSNYLLGALLGLGVFAPRRRKN